MRGLWILLLALLVGAAALAGMVWLVVGPEAPSLPNLALFLVLIVPAAAGLLAPVLAWLHRRVPFGGQPPSVRAALRQGLLVGLGLALMAGLQLVRLLDATLILGILALVVLLEVLAQSRAT